MGNNSTSNSLISKIIGGYRKRQNLILGLLILVFWFSLFMPTISITKTYPDAPVKDFAIMRPVSVPTTGDVRITLNYFKTEIGDAYSFDHLYNNVYILFVMGLVALFMCFKKFNKGLISKLVALGYSGFALYSIFCTANMGHVLSTHDTGYIFKIVVAALIALVSLGGIAFVISDLAKNSWLKYVNVHIFLNSICSGLMLTTLSVMFMPFEYGNHTVSIMGYLLLPNNYKGGFANAFQATIPDFDINGVILIPLLLLLIGILGGIFAAGYYKNIVVPVMSIAWGALCIVGCFINPLMVLDPKYIIYVVISVVVILAAAYNLYEHYKANAIYRQ